jgi:hypothetical protein
LFRARQRRSLRPVQYPSWLCCRQSGNATDAHFLPREVMAPNTNISMCITSGNRSDLLKASLESFYGVVDQEPQEVLIYEDSGGSKPEFLSGDIWRTRNLRWISGNHSLTGSSAEQHPLNYIARGLAVGATGPAVGGLFKPSPLPPVRIASRQVTGGFKRPRHGLTDPVGTPPPSGLARSSTSLAACRAPRRSLSFRFMAYSRTPRAGSTIALGPETGRSGCLDLGSCTTVIPADTPAGYGRSSAPLSGAVGGRALADGVLVCDGVSCPISALRTNCES